MPFDGKALAQEVIQAMKSHVDSVVLPLKEKIAALVSEIETLKARAPEKGEKGDAGRDGKDGQDGKSVTPDDIRPMLAVMVDKAFGELRMPSDGKDGANGKDGKDGADGKDAVNLAGAMIDRDGNLVLTLSDGKQVPLGAVIGKDGAKGDPGRDGEDGLGFEDMEVVYDGERSFGLRFMRGATVKEFGFSLPIVLDRGVWKDGEFKRGDGVTRDGSFWVCQVETTTGMPGASPDWRLAARRGREGKSVTLTDVEPMIQRLVDLKVNGLKADKA
jgi:uncharacterized small protein (DUF1192 family)